MICGPAMEFELYSCAALLHAAWSYDLTRADVMNFARDRCVAVLYYCAVALVLWVWVTSIRTWLKRISEREGTAMSRVSRYFFCY